MTDFDSSHLLQMAWAHPSWGGFSAAEARTLYSSTVVPDRSRKETMCDLLNYQSSVETKNNCKEANVRDFHLFWGGQLHSPNPEHAVLP